MPNGMNRSTGKSISGREHLVQSIQILLSTPLGSRVMLPAYGSAVVDLIDQGTTDSARLRIYKATLESLKRWEPRLDTQRVQAKFNEQGEVEITIEGIYENVPLEIQGIQIGGA